MIFSMTGYGRAETLWEGKKIVVEMKSLNHRYLDVTVRTPLALGAYEIDIKRRIGERFARGKIDVTVRIENDSGGEAHIGLNMDKARRYISLFRRLQEELSIPGEITLSLFKDFRDVFEPQDTAAVTVPWEVLETVLEETLENLTLMRIREGDVLERDLLVRSAVIKGLLAEVTARAPDVLRAYRNRLLNRIRELLDTCPVDESRIYQEVAIMAEKSDITEELVRMDSHLEQFSSLLEEGKAVGRKVDFLIQEMMREINTLGAKSNDGDIARCVIEMKNELSKLREQVQNIE